MVDLKCGKCKTAFPLLETEYLKRVANENEVLHLINCPSCLNPLPYALQNAFKAFLVALNNEKDWKIGTRLSNED